MLENAKVSLNADQASAYYLYSKDYKVSEIKPSYLLNMAYKKLNEKEIKTNSVNVTVEEEALKNAFLELFGTLDTYKPTAFSFNCLNFKYEKDHNRYVALQQTCNSNKEILENITDMYEERNQLYILTTATIYDKNESSYYKFDNLFDPILNDVSEKDLTTNNKKLNQYQYIFKKVEDTYYFDSITKLK